MYKRFGVRRTSINRNNSTEGETLEMKVERIVNNKEPITDGAPTIFTDRKDGVLPGYDIRTDRFDVAIDAMDTVSKSHQSKRADRLKRETEELNKKTKGDEKTDGLDSGAKSTQGTDNSGN